MSIRDHMRWAEGLAAIVGGVVALAGGLAGIAAYFATKDELGASHCVTMENIKVLRENQISQLESQRVLARSTLIDRLRGQEDAAADIARLEREIAVHERRARDAQQRAIAADRALRDGNCGVAFALNNGG